MPRLKISPWLRLAKELHRYMRRRVKDRPTELSPELTPEWIEETICKQAYRCAKTKLLFSIEHNSPWRPSLDRIDPKKGYILENVQIVSWMYNSAKNKWPESELNKFATALAAEVSQGASAPYKNNKNLELAVSST